mmetsp:Transcript_4347/g.6403  ORF Transcript_4347/g.6403 Transcript_4347/m.6403 type:complete len:228 (+) Transcript_4347:96-779(+)
MGALFSKKKLCWVPDHRKLEDLIDDSQRWKTAVDMTGWQIQSSLTDRFSSQMIESRGTVEVNLSFNGLGDDECDELAKVIKQSKTIKRLILENNHIHEKGAQALAQALTPETGKEDPHLEVLVLRNNSIGSEGATAISQALTCNRTLRKVDMYWNNIGNKGLEAICNTLRPDFPRDFVLDVRYNGYDVDDTSIDWQEMMKKVNQSNINLEGTSGPTLLGHPLAYRCT